MESNFNDIIDVILTFNKNEELSKNIAVSGSIVPYIVTNKESLECHTDFYFLVKHKKINDVRDIIKKGEKKLFEYEEKLLFMKRTLNTEKKIEKVLSELTKIQKDYSDKQIANVLETIKKELNCLV